MARRIPLLQRGALVGISDESIAVGTRAWFAWLETATTFGVLLDDGHFTARKERASNGRGGWYWRAYRRQHGRLLRSYLGASGDLSLERLREAAARLTQPAGASISPRRGSSVDAARRQTGHLDNQKRLHREDDGSNAAPPLRLRLLGAFSLTSGKDVPLDIRSTRVRTLLAYLALHRASAIERQQLSFLFWPDSTEAQARNNLRQLVHQLRRAWPACHRCLSLGPSKLAWRPEVRLEIDVEVFERSVALADVADRAHDAPTLLEALRQALRPYGGDLLPSCFEDWVTSDRERLRQVFARVLDRLISRYKDDGDFVAAIEYAQQRLRHDPLHERGYRQLMQLYALNDDSMSALRTYHACVSTLERELGVAPSRATRKVYEDLLGAHRRTGVTVVKPPTTAVAAPLIGRPSEWDQLQCAWRAASMGSVHMAVLSGDAGIGKSRLAEELIVWAGRQGIATATSRAYATESHLPYAPLADWLRSPALRSAVSRLDSETLSEIVRIVPEFRHDRADVPRPSAQTEPAQRLQFFESLARAVLSTNEPLILLLDDLQWCDQDTLQWLDYLLRSTSDAALLIVGALRAEDLGHQHQLTKLLREFRGTATLTELALGPLDASATAELGACLAGRGLHPEEARHLYEETEGYPLFVVEMVRGRLASTNPRSSLRPQTAALGARGRTANLGLPPRVHAVIEARLSQLSPSATETLRLASTIGRDFTLELLLEASDRDASDLVGALDELWQRRIVREHGGTAYDFSHHKIREVVYASMSAARRTVLHCRVAQALEQLSGATLDEVSAQIAMHYERGGLPGAAVPYLQRAAALAQCMYAHAQAILLLPKGLALNAMLPPSHERDGVELNLHTAMGTSLVATTFYGSPEVIAIYQRCQQLCDQLGQPPSPPVLRGLALVAIVQSRFDEAYRLGEHLVSTGTRNRDGTAQVEGHYVQGVALFWTGAIAASRLHLELALSQYAPEQVMEHLKLYSQDPRVVCLSRLAMDLWLLGYPRAALERGAEALQVAHGLAHPFTHTYALGWSAMLAIEQHTPGLAAQRAEEFLGKSQELDLRPTVAQATVLRGWARAELDDRQLGIEEMRAGIAKCRALHAEYLLPFFLCRLAEQLARLGRIEQAFETMTHAFTIVERTGERWYESELHRVVGMLRREQGEDDAAEQAFGRALAISRAQTTRTLELRAATALAGLWRQQCRLAEADELLGQTCAWFDGSLDTLDLIEARSELDACRQLRRITVG